MIEEWLAGTPEPAEIHVSGQTFQGIKLPTLPDEHGLAILGQPVAVLGKSVAYPYGLTKDKIERLQKAGIATVGQLADSSDQRLDQIDYIGKAMIKRIRGVVYQAIWM